MSKYILATLLFFCFVVISPAQDFNGNFQEVLFKNQLTAVPYDNPELNFLPDTRGVFAGDINGDGINDMVGSYGEIAGDERTADLSDITYKSLIYFGGNTSGRHDQIVHSEIRPVGDINGDGFDDALGFNFDRTVSYYFGSTEGYVKGTGGFEKPAYPGITGFRDFNDDGYEDIFFSFNSDRRFRFRIIFGGASEADFIDQEYMLNFPIFFIPAKLDKDVIVALSASQFASGPITLITYEINPDDLSLDERSVVTLEFGGSIDNRPIFNTMDVNNDGLEEIYSPSIDTRNGVNTALILKASEEQHTSLQLVETDLSEPGWFIIGDVDSDGSTDFARSIDQRLQISYGQEDLSQGFSVDKEFTFEELTPNYDFTFSTPYREFGLGDFNGDGIDDFNIFISSESLVGNRIYFGDSDRAHDNPYDIVYNRGDFTALLSLIESVNIADSNADGFEDLVLLFSDRTEIFLGGKFSTTPDISMPSSGLGNSSIETGDFNGDGINDLIIVSIHNGQSGLENRIDLFFGNNGFVGGPDLTLMEAPLDPDNLKQGAFDITNAGDFNHDGKDDFIVAFLGVQYFQLFYGGDNISTTADLILNGFDSDFGIEGLSTEALSSGYRIEGISDVNGDGIDDIAIADLGRELNLPATTRVNKGAVFIFFGSQHTSAEFDNLQPDDIIVLNETGFIRYVSFGLHLAGGDFNGDGQGDLLVSPKGYGRSSDPSNPQRDELVFIYHGGTTFDTRYDQAFELPGNSAENPELASFNGIAGEIQKLDDINGDGADEIIFSNRDPFNGGVTSTRAMLILGSTSISEESLPAAIFTAPNLFSGLGPSNGAINREFGFATGDFDGDGIPEVILQLTNDLNNRNRPVYTFPLENPEKEPQTIDFVLTEEISISEESISLEATASSNLPVLFNVVSGPATINNNLLVFSGGGPIVIEASQPGNDVFNKAPLVRRTITIAKKDQTINFNDIDDKIFGEEPFELTATSDAGLEIAYTVESGSGTLDGNSLTLTGAGMITINASQAGDDRYNAAATVSQTFEVLKADQVITIDEVSDKVFGDDPFALNASSDAELTLDFTITSGPATVTDNTVTITGAGEIVITTSQAGNDNYNNASASITVTVAKADQVITIEEVSAKVFGDDPFALNANSDAELTLDVTITSGPATVTDNTVTITGAGEIVITASQAGNDNYNTASANITVTVAKADQAITFTAIDPKTIDDTPFVPVVTASSGEAITLEVVSGPATVSEGTITLTGTLGTVTVRAIQAGDDNYNAATAVEQSFEVTLVTSIEPDPVLQDINLYPNPVSDQVTISLKNMALHQFKTLSLTDIDGVLISTTPLNQTQDEVTLDISGLKSGLYLIQVHSEKGISTLKLMKQD